jgi:NAD(P)H-dependent FMN reductase
MSSVANVVVLVGSLRKESLNRKLANALIALNAAPLKFEIAEIGNLPLYNQDLDGDNPPPTWVALRRLVKGADAVLFVTPEYNRSVPGCLKNALDVASRPYGSNNFDGKPGAVISVARRGRRFRSESPPAPISGLFKCANHAATGSLHRGSSNAFRCGGQICQRQHA